MHENDHQNQTVWTVARIAERTGHRRHNIEYMINKWKIQPVAWAGNARIFDQHDVDLIICQLWRMGVERKNAVRGLRARTREECATPRPQTACVAGGLSASAPGMSDRPSTTHKLPLAHLDQASDCDGGAS